MNKNALLKRLDAIAAEVNTKKVIVVGSSEWRRLMDSTPKTTAEELDAMFQRTKQLKDEPIKELLLAPTRAGHRYRKKYFLEKELLESMKEWEAEETETMAEKTARTKAWFLGRKEREEAVAGDESPEPVVGWQ